MAFDFLFCLGGLGGAQGAFEFLEFFIEILLALGEITQSAEHLQLLALLGFLQLAGLSLGFVAVFLFTQIQLIQLALGALIGLLLLLAGLLLLLLADLELMGLQAEQGLVGGLFRGECGHQGSGFLRGLGELVDGAFHVSDHGLDVFGGFFVAAFIQEYTRLGQGLGLALNQYGRVLGQSGGLAAEFPGGVDDLFLQLDQFLGLLIGGLLLLLLLLLLLAGITLTKDLLEGSDLGKEHIAVSAARLAVGPGVFGPEEPVDELIRFHFKGFQR